MSTTLIYKDKTTTIELINGNIIKTKDIINSNEIIAQKKAYKIGLAPRIYIIGENYIEMDYIKGITLDQYLKNNCDRSNLKYKIREALVKLYDIGIKHNDITGNNVIITPENEIKILDYKHSIIYDYPVPKKERDFSILKNF
jgi:putative serine/threonine protein kinase